MCAALIPGVAAAANPDFPGDDPDESVRLHTPDDPDFDRCEPDNEEGPAECSNVFDQEFARFGFAPAATDESATYKNGTAPPRAVEQNTRAGRNPTGQLSGVSADRAWQLSIGDPRVTIAILDTGINWDDSETRKKIALNPAELPRPRQGGRACARDDCNRDGAFDVDDYAEDPRVGKQAGQDKADELLDASDLIAAFSDGDDDDRNAYVDDIAGWDFFDDDNDPFDQSSYASAENHGTGRAQEAGAQTNNGERGTGVCPRCQIVPMRVWDSFVVDMNNFGQAVGYAADNGIAVVEGAVGGQFNSRFARQVFSYAYRKGVFLAIVSSDINSANHNWPTYYDESLMVSGTVADAHGLGENPPQQFIDFFGEFGLQFPGNIPVGTWFRNSGLTQYGGHAHIVMPATTGSQATGQASGAAGLLISYGRRRGLRLAPNEVKQILTGTAEDVLPENTLGTGVPDPAQRGWDQHFGYGRPDLGAALERVRDRRIPPQALITSPEWFAPLEVGRRKTVAIEGRLSARRAAGFTYRLQWAPGIEPSDQDFQTVEERSSTRPVEGSLGKVDLEAVRQALDDRSITCPTNVSATGGSTCDPTAPAKGPGDRDPNEPSFTVRVLVTDSAGNRAEDRKTLYAFRDDTLGPGWPMRLGSGGEASMRMFNLDRRNHLEVIVADSGGRLQVLEADGTPEEPFNRGRPVHTRPYPNVHFRAPVYRRVDPPREVLRTPAIGDIDGDLEPEIVDSAGEHVYAWHADGRRVKGFPVRLDPSKSRPRDRTRDNHIKRGFAASPTLGDLTGDGGLEIVIPGLDQWLYGWDGKGRELPGFPVQLREPDSEADGAESVSTAALGDIAGDDRPEIVAPTNETSPGQGAPIPLPIDSPVSSLATTEGRIYAFDHEGELLPGWPARPSGIGSDILPFVGPGIEQALGDVDGDGSPEVLGYITGGNLQARDANGDEVVTYAPEADSGETVDKSLAVNTFETPIVAEFDGAPGLEVIKGGVTLGQILNLLVVGQNFPYNHIVQAWNGESGKSLPTFPQAVEDYQLLSSPAVADVSDAPGKELTLGTGLYLLRNINAQGIEGSGWPKFTGGWLYAVPAIGDADQDGKLDVATLTREGFAFLWKTDRPACGGNDEWWTSRHDEWSTGAYGTDTRPPGVPEKLKVEREGGQATLTWTAPGDDHLCGKADRFRVLASGKQIQRPSDGEPVGEDTDASSEAGESETATVELPAGTRHVAVLYRDDAGNWGHLTSRSVPKGSG